MKSEKTRAGDNGVRREEEIGEQERPVMEGAIEPYAHHSHARVAWSSANQKSMAAEWQSRTTLATTGLCRDIPETNMDTTGSLRGSAVTGSRGLTSGWFPLPPQR
jgi:hypothetical protein